MKRRNVTLFLIIIAMLVFTVVALVYPLFGRKGMQLGLDLKGGVYLEYQVQYPEGTSTADQTTLINKAVDVITTRIDKYGVTAPIVQALGNSRISVQLPGYSDVNQAKNLVEQTGFLEFRQVELDSSGNPVTINNYLNQTNLAFIDQSDTGDRFFISDLAAGTLTAVLQKNSDGTMGFVDANGNPLDIATLKTGATSMYSWEPARGTDGTQLTGSLLSSATSTIQTSNTGAAQPVVSIAWDSKGTIIFNQIAANLYVRPTSSIQRALGIFLDRNIISYPQINEPSYSNGQAVIEGSFTTQETKTLANLLTSGSLPIPIQKPAISATLGANFVSMSIQGGIIALVLIMLFMIAYYRIPGVAASLALLFYGVVILAIFKLIPVTLNLAGIAGFVLSLGMAVDANILIFERMKEELRGGRTLGAAIEAGFDRAWLAIRDSNVTTIIGCVILYWIGNVVVAGEQAKGFALTLFIGAIVSMFSAITVTRTLLRLVEGTSISQKTSLFSVWSGRK
jgi:preprotein translocase subunit SecD